MSYLYFHELQYTFGVLGVAFGLALLILGIGIAICGALGTLPDETDG